MTGSLCSIVSVLSCVAACYVVVDCQLWYEIKELLLLLLLLLLFCRKWELPVSQCDDVAIHMVGLRSVAMLFPLLVTL